MAVTSRQLRAARELLGLRQADVAQATGLCIDTVSRSETSADDRPDRIALKLIVAKLEVAGIEFITGGVRLKYPLPTA